MAKEYTPAARNRAAYEAMTEVTGNVPPQAVELEEAVLGALMLEKDAIIAVQEYLTPEAFYTEEHRLIFRAISELSMELKPIDLYTVTERLKVKQELKKVPGKIAQLVEETMLSVPVVHHATLEQVFESDLAARAKAKELLKFGGSFAVVYRRNDGGYGLIDDVN